MNSCNNEIWSHRLVTNPTEKLLDVREPNANQFEKREKVPAFRNDLNFSED